MLRECLVSYSMRLGVPFIAPRQLGAIGHQFGRQFLPSVEWCTGQSGAPPDNHCSCVVLDFFPYGAQPTVGPRDRLVHRTLSGAHRTVRCAQLTVGATTCRTVTPQVLLRVSTPGLPLLTLCYIKFCMGKVPQTLNSRS
jgi:hypothetical protein